MARAGVWTVRGKQSIKVAIIAAFWFDTVASAHGLPGIGASDQRRPVSVAEPPFDALVRVQTELGGRCTGFLVAPALVMTAAHCLYQPRAQAYLQPGSVHVLAAYRSGAWRAHARVVRFVIPRGYAPAAEAATAGADRALLVLGQPVGTAAQTLALRRPPALPLTVRLAGYGQDREERAVESPPCAVTGPAADGQGRALLAHGCQATAGTSGAPLVWLQPDGRWAAIGVQIEARDAQAGGLAVPVLDATPSDRSAGR